MLLYGNGPRIEGLRVGLGVFVEVFFSCIERALIVDSDLDSIQTTSLGILLLN